MEYNLKLINLKEKESNDMIRQKDMKIKEHFEIVNAVKFRNTSLENEVCDMKIIVKNTTAELQKIIQLRISQLKKHAVKASSPGEELGAYKKKVFTRKQLKKQKEKEWNPRFYCCAPIGANRACCSLELSWHPMSGVTKM